MMKNLSPEMRFICILPILIFPATCAIPLNQIRAKKVSPTIYEDSHVSRLNMNCFF